MHHVRTFLLGATRVLLVAFLLGGLTVVTGQVVALAAGDRHLMELFGTDVTEVVCVVAGAAGICSFLLLYVRDRGTGDQDGGEEDGVSVWD
ncbi:hypothetical protein [Streptomyces aureocirculatus]|uniref:hypothetical protein n=1 Tax=Streptomyces aureocirculatus TaxID=67275 RepID=UPI000690DC34|nr:hypothetical protein [Streptomyces aureocirculatus]